MWKLILFSLCMLVLAFVVLKLSRKGPSPHDTYICEVCGKKDCICRKESKGL